MSKPPCSRGVTDLLQVQRGVWLAKLFSAEALGASLLAALEASYSTPRHHHAFVDRFAIERAIPAYENLLDTVCSERAM